MTPEMKDNIPEGWHTYTLGEIYTERKEAGDPELPILTVSIHSGVSDGALDEEEIGKTVKRIADKTQYKTARVGDLVFNMMRAWQGAIGVARSDGLVSPAYIVATPNDELVYPLFMDYYMKSPRMVGIINRQSYGVTDFRKRLYWDSFAPIKCTLPDIAEQRKIVAILAKQDKVIELQQEKSDELVALKKACLSKMFPCKGAKVPEFRFKGFSDDWKRRRFRDFTHATGKRNKENLPLEPFAITNEKGFIAQKDAHEEFGYMKDTDRSAYMVVQPNSFAYNPARINVGSIGYYTGDVDVIVSSLYEVFQTSEDIDDNFLLHWLKSPALSYWIEKLQEGSVRQYFYYDKMQEITMFVPSLKEQREISEFFDSLDNTIALHQRKLEQEKQKKKALMQLLLTGIVRV